MNMPQPRDPAEVLGRLRSNLAGVLVGKNKVIRSLLTGLLADGHVLLEDVPGVGKTVLARALAKSLDATFRRIQFTPDLLPSDVVGVSVYDQERQKFVFRPGPLFTHVLLADEINRATPKTQACLLESMAEQQVSVEGKSYPLKKPFFVIATQNPIESHGCYPLPEAQLDRFTLRFSIGYPEPAQERQILEDQVDGHPLDRVESVCDVETLVSLQARVREVTVKPELLDYIIQIVGATRTHEDLHLGASPRGALALRRASQATALLSGRNFVIPDDVKENVGPSLAHRLILKHRAMIEGRRTEHVLADIVRTVPVEG